MASEPEQPPVESPCTRICVLDETLGYCIGCGRTGGEIGRWSTASPGEQRRIVADAAVRKSGRAAGS